MEGINLTSVKRTKGTVYGKHGRDFSLQSLLNRVLDGKSWITSLFVFRLTGVLGFPRTPILKYGRLKWLLFVVCEKTGTPFNTSNWNLGGYRVKMGSRRTDRKEEVIHQLTENYEDFSSFQTVSYLGTCLDHEFFGPNGPIWLTLFHNHLRMQSELL